MTAFDRVRAELELGVSDGLVDAAVEMYGGNSTHIAIALGVSHRTFVRWLTRYHGLRRMVDAARAAQKAKETRDVT